MSVALTGRRKVADNERFLRNAADARETGYGIGNLTKHTIREEDDGTISVRPGDGSSNSILITGAHGRTWHGYIERGVWNEC